MAAMVGPKPPSKWRKTPSGLLDLRGSFASEKRAIPKK